MTREVKFNSVHPFHWAQWSYLLAGFLAVLSLLARNRILRLLPFLPLLLGIGFHVWGIRERTVLSGRAMIGNFFESMLFVAVAAAVLGLLFELWFRRKWFLVVSGFLAFLALAVALNNPDFMNPKISTLVPVLINNFWIHIHVPTIMTSYAALGLAALLAHVYLVRYLFTPARHPGMRDLSNFLYWTIPVGVTFLFVGIVLGGVWADQSWGRFWGWDPKETWSLVTWLVFMVVIHGRWSGWLRDFGTAVGGIVGGWALLWTYWGGNFYQSGLHSYAGASAEKEIPIWLWSFAGFEFLLLGGSALVHFVRRGGPPALQGGAPLPIPTEASDAEAEVVHR